MLVFTTIFVGLIIFTVFAFALIVELWYYLAYFARLAFYKKTELPIHTPLASVIVYARNKENDLAEFLPFIFNQDYPEFEVVVVNDCSYDNTTDILNEFAKKYPNLKIVTLKENKNHYHGKKVALMMGIKGATHEHLLLTDAGSKPNSTDWLRNMVQHFTPETEIVLGYGAYEKRKGFLNKMIRFDTFMIALQFLSFAMAGKTYMGTGRNLAYKKSLFFKMKGFASHYHIEPGDDDLFVNEAATKHNSKIEVMNNSHTISRVRKTLKEWFFQKRLHGGTFRHYNFKSMLRLTSLRLSQYLFFLSFITLVIIQFEPVVVVSIFTLRLLIQMIIFSKSMRLLAEKDLLLFAPILEPLLLIINPLMMITNIFIKKNKWMI